MPRITKSMRRFWGDRTAGDHFGFSGNRACMACLYSRPGGATQREVNEVSANLGSSQRNYLNMLRAAQKWGHQVVVWHDKRRGGKVYKLRYNPAHTANSDVLPPDNWKEANRIGVPPAAMLSEWA